jgi:hypothetical protein
MVSDEESSMVQQKHEENEGDPTRLPETVRVRARPVQ